nr:MAG TPA: hypothetical protein [Caudoviricetes sp.]
MKKSKIALSQEVRQRLRIKRSWVRIPPAVPNEKQGILRTATVLRILCFLHFFEKT